MTVPAFFARRMSEAEADEVFSRLNRRLPHLFAGASRATPVGALPLDSLDVVELLCATEDEFGVLLASEIYETAHTVDDLVRAIVHGRPDTKGAS
jgi:acyl carrier protein